MENKVIRAITFKEKAFCTLLTYKDAYIVNGTLTVIAGKDIVDGFIYWDSTPTVEVNNICYFSTSLESNSGELMHGKIRVL